MRGLKSALKKSQRARLSGRGSRRCFVECETKKKLKGLTKMLESRLFSDGMFAKEATHGHDPGRWSHTSGRARGARVDAQLSRIVNGNLSASAARFKMVSMLLAFLKTRKLTPVIAQQIVRFRSTRLATAIDLVCHDEVEPHVLWLCELKTGYAGDRDLPARKQGRPCFLKAPLQKALDSHRNRHIAQAALGREMFLSDATLVSSLQQRFGICETRVAVLYVNGNGAELVQPDESYWHKKAPLALRQLVSG
jgi:hypothetical protein